MADIKAQTLDVSEQIFPIDKWNPIILSSFSNIDTSSVKKILQYELISPAKDTAYRFLTYVQRTAKENGTHISFDGTPNSQKFNASKTVLKVEGKFSGRYELTNTSVRLIVLDWNWAVMANEKFGKVSPLPLISDELARLIEQFKKVDPEYIKIVKGMTTPSENIEADKGTNISDYNKNEAAALARAAK